MSLLGLNKFWSVDVTDADAPILKLNDVAFSNKFLADVGAKQELVGMQRAILALADPVAEVGEVSAAYNAEMALIIPIIKSDYGRLTKAGIPDSVAEKYALEKGEEMFAASKKLLSRIHPLVINNPDVLLSRAAGVDLRTRESKGKAVKAPKIAK